MVCRNLRLGTSDRDDFVLHIGQGKPHFALNTSNLDWTVEWRTVGGIDRRVVGGAAQYWLWGLAILLDLVAAGVSARAAEWDIHPEHFAERHGLFVIIALGETLIIAGSGMTDLAWTSGLLVVAVLVVAVTCGLWWSYFPRAMLALEHALASSDGSERSTIARDSYTLIHFLMLAGVVAYAAAIEGGIAHAATAMPSTATAALALGMTLFVGGMAAALWRATGTLPRERLLVSVAAAVAIVATMGANIVLALGIALIATIAIGVVEQRAGASIAADR